MKKLTRGADIAMLLFYKWFDDGYIGRAHQVNMVEF